MQSATTVQAAKEQLHEAVREEAPFLQKAQNALEIGARCLGTDYGGLTQIDQLVGHRKPEITIQAESQRDFNLRQDLDETYCRQTIADTESPLALHSASSQDWADDPPAEIDDFDTYLGVPLIPDKRVYGTVLFVAESPRPEPFNDTETWFAEHLTRLLERELKRQDTTAQLTSQAKVATVLGRVLRHNVRNNATVIRGYTEMLASELGDTDAATVVREHIDDLIRVAEESRKLQKITPDDTRQQTEIGALIEDIAESLTKAYPTATISVACDEQLSLDVGQNFSQAYIELIENAIEHSGDRATVTVEIEPAPNDAVIRIQDNGPGISPHEAEVLSAGAEGPLTHGSGIGLWLANQIIASYGGDIDTVVTEEGTTIVTTIPRRGEATARQQTIEPRRSHDRYRAAFEEGAEAKIITDNEGRIIAANSQAGSLHAVDQQTLLGKPIEQFLPEEVPFDTTWEELQNEGQRRGTMTIFGAESDETSVEYSATANIVPGEHLIVSRVVDEN